ncbi:MAG TPA: hypothetical protein VI485_26485 [Vicinamibacterales bacterium]|nr:hypothetical protein [Vicinamibacterales bacterium]
MPVDAAKIIAEIEKSGFPLELRVAAQLTRHHFIVDHNLYYVDKDDGKGREIEISALKNSQADRRGAVPDWIRHRFLVECKKTTDKPWVFFTSPTTHYDREASRIRISGLRREARLTDDLLKPVSTSHPFWNWPRRGRSYFEAFRSAAGAEAPSNIFKAITTVVKATLWAYSAVVQRGPMSMGELSIFQPVIVIEGDLFEATINDAGVVSLTAQPLIPVSFTYQSAQYPEERFTILVMQESFLPDFLTRMDGVLTDWANLFHQNQDLVATTDAK